jgi:uncharacterized membrane protein YfcA
MKRYAMQQSALILLALSIIAGAIYGAPFIMSILPNVSYKFVLFFLIVILLSNILAKIIYVYINL